MILRDPIRSPSRRLPAAALILLALALPSWTGAQPPEGPDDPPRAAVDVLNQENPLPESRVADDPASGQLPPAARARLLRIRRDAQAAAVARAEARRDMAAALVARNAALNRKIPNTASREEIEKAEGELRVAAADLDGEKARLAEAELLLDPRRPDAAAAPLDREATDDRPRTLADWRDLAEMAVLQLEGKQAERQRAETGVGHARIKRDNTEALFKKKVVSPNEVAISQNELQHAEDEVRVKEAEVRQAELRLKQARRRAEAEETRLRGRIAAARAEFDRTKSRFGDARIPYTDVEAAGARLDDLMFQLDPDHKPDPR